MTWAYRFCAFIEEEPIRTNGLIETMLSYDRLPEKEP
jgi:hypothetical protein